MKNKPNFFFDNRGFPNWGGGPLLGNFSHIIPFFSLITTLSGVWTSRTSIFRNYDLSSLSNFYLIPLWGGSQSESKFTVSA